MDGLLAEINNKRKTLEVDVGESSADGARKYMRRAEVEAAREAEARRKREEAAKAKENAKSANRAARMREEKASLARLASPGSGRDTPNARDSPAPGTEKEGFNISPEEAVRRLRAKGQPIRLFGETDKDRRLRLRALELLEERGEHPGLNDFRKTFADLESAADEKEAGRLARESHRKAQDGGKEDEAPVEEKKSKSERVDVGVLDLSLVKTDPNKLYPIIYHAIKNVLKEWEEWMDARPDEVKQTMQGKLAAATQVSSAQNLKPLFRQLRSRDMAADVLRNLSEIVHFMQTRQYSKANDAYLRMSIGNAAWPIGVTSVGIHERSAREKIGQDNIAHVLNDEVSRKWIQAIKRLLTFSQTVRPPDLAAQLMG
ncbi:Prp18 domain-domain-containing protein [Kockovaella imperatae]|uniref:Pre-mRNA-splicing factor 18 n=1 Tax=Kockovaella imperatae TaxID=4999 RepID=A0A1Y1UP10_9TREE|nr:Prp18 domain-domain-containing protein [Kockovaella imperatae]ORX39206.1 Prp18 domain-domain-containing protein [Kockovaella imperatae]